MNEFLTFLKNLDYFLIVDLIVMITLAVLILLFFKRRNNLRLAVIVAIYILIYFGVSIATAYSPINILFITQGILRYGIIFLIVAFCVVYQQDLKAFCSRLSRWNERKDNPEYGKTDDDLRLAAGEIVKACQTMSKNDIGALIVIAPNNVPNHILDTGIILNAQISSGLLQSIFNTKAPLHDGAVVIKDTLILGAGCFLPISQREDISKDLGTRHRAAVGITEESDVLAIVVSEETGVISIVKKGEIRRYMTPEKLLEEIENAYGVNYVNRKYRKRKNEDEQ